MTFTFPLNPIQNQVAINPLGQRYIYMSEDEGWRSAGTAKSPAGTVGVTIDTSLFIIGSPVNLSFSSAATSPSSGVNPPFSYTISSGRLPAGLTINGGNIVGTPTVANEIYSFLISVLDSAGYLVNTIVFNGQVSSLVTTDYVAALISSAVAADVAADLAAYAASFSSSAASAAASDIAAAASATAASNSAAEAEAQVNRINGAEAAAAISASAASSSAANASSSASQAAVSAAQAATLLSESVGIATEQAQVATTQATVAAGQATSAAASVSTITTSAASAATSETAAAISATSANESATVATTQAQIAISHATDAGLSATAASAAATSITTSAANATVSQTAAATSATAATTSAATATTQANVATTQAGAAAASATSATTSAATATTQASNAAASALSAAALLTSTTTQAVAAATQATNAAESASSAASHSTTATTQAAAASGSAATAAASATSAETWAASAQGYSNSVAASVTVNSAAIAALDGYVNTSYGVKLDANNYVTGFQVINGGTPASNSFVVRADLFEIVHPGYAATPLMTVSTVNGVNQLTFNGNLIADGSISSASINTGAVTNAKIGQNAVDGWRLAGSSVSTGHIAGGAVSLAAAGTSNNGTTVGFSLNEAGIIQVLAYGYGGSNSISTADNYNGGGPGTYDANVYLRIYVDGNLVFQSQSIEYIPAGGLNVTNSTTSIQQPYNFDSNGDWWAVTTNALPQTGIWLGAIGAGYHSVYVIMQGQHTGWSYGTTEVSVIGLMR